MRKDLKVIRLPHHSPEWFNFRRTQGIGGSEVGTILGINKYDSAVRLYHEKVGTYLPPVEDNRLMFWGREHEDKIAQIWQHWDGTPDGYIENKKAGRIIRKCRSVNGYVVNPDYPWLFASLDRVINREGGINMITGEPLQSEAVLECKTLSFWAANVWKDGIPPYYLAQVHQYMLILDVDYAEIAILKDGNTFDVEYIERNEEFMQRLILRSKQFWYEVVLPAREAKIARDLADIEDRIYDAERYDTIIQHNEPPPDDSEAYREFMNERYIRVREKLKGTMQLYNLCKKDEVLKKVIGQLEKKRSLVKNILIKVLVEEGSDHIDFGTLGSVNWAKRKGSDTRTLTIRIAEKPDLELIEKEADIVNLKIY